MRPGNHQVAGKSVGHMMTLPRDYGTIEEIKIVLLEVTELDCQRCRALGFMGHDISAGCMWADFDRPTGFSRQMKMEAPSDTMQVYRWPCKLLEEHWDGLLIRRVGISLMLLSPDNEYQMSRFDTGLEK